MYTKKKIARVKAGASGLRIEYRHSSNYNLRVDVKCRWLDRLLRKLGWHAPEAPLMDPPDALEDSPSDR